MLRAGATGVSLRRQGTLALCRMLECVSELRARVLPGVPGEVQVRREMTRPFDVGRDSSPARVLQSPLAGGLRGNRFDAEWLR